MNAIYKHFFDKGLVPIGVVINDKLIWAEYKGKLGERLIKEDCIYLDYGDEIIYLNLSYRLPRHQIPDHIIWGVVK